MCIFGEFPCPKSLEKTWGVCVCVCVCVCVGVWEGVTIGYVYVQ